MKLKIIFFGWLVFLTSSAIAGNAPLFNYPLVFDGATLNVLTPLTVQGAVVGASGTVGATGSQGIPGPIGATGTAGVAGATGSQGIPGEIGATGSQGIPGEIGATGTAGLITVTTKTATYTVLITDGAVICDATSATFTLTLPAVSGNSGVIITVTKIDAISGIIVKGDDSETINGANTLTLTKQWESVDLLCNGASWTVK